MELSETERRAAETILERGVRVALPAPRFLRLLGKKEIGVTIKQPNMGTLLMVSELSLKEGFSFDGIDSGNLDAAHALISKHTKTCIRIVAVIILGSKLKVRLFSRLLSRWMLWKVTPRRLFDMVLMTVTLSGVQDFTNSIRLIRSMTVTMPRNLSPQDQGSKKDEQ